MKGTLAWLPHSRAGLVTYLDVQTQRVNWLRRRDALAKCRSERNATMVKTSLWGCSQVPQFRCALTSLRVGDFCLDYSLQRGYFIMKGVWNIGRPASMIPKIERVQRGYLLLSDHGQASFCLVHEACMSWLTCSERWLERIVELGGVVVTSDESLQTSCGHQRRSWVRIGLLKIFEQDWT